MLRVLMGFVALWVLGWALLGWTEEAPRRNPQLAVFVMNDADASDQTIVDAERDAARVFQRAGVDVDWMNCGRADAGERYPRCGGQNMTAALVVRLVPRARTLSPGILGVSFLAHDTGTYADIFFDPIQQLRDLDKQVSLAAILGNVIAHELGHLLLGSNAHSAEGIMQPHWDAQLLHGITTGQMRFTAEQSARMRGRVASLQKKNYDAPVFAAVTR
jgi:hypothetical protein